MKINSLAFLFVALLSFAGCKSKNHSSADFQKLADDRKSDLQLSTYVTAQTVDRMFTSETGRREVLSLLHCYGITKVYMEVYRGGLVISPEEIKKNVLFLKENGFEVAGGIATVPGENFGKAQDGPLGWFNWQNQKTQTDLKKVIEDSAPFFNTFIIDDFLCTADTSAESKQAKGDRSWSEYRRSLMTGLCESVFIKPAKEKNPGIKLIIKYPQWYDRFHLFGYDVATEPELFDGVWVGTESRGQYTQRFGFVQPYEGFVNFRWLSSIAGAKTGGAWFDHEDCSDIDFVDQAYQSVLAGAKELVLFSFDSFITGNPGHHLLMQDFEKLADLAQTVSKYPVTGATAYKPPNSDAGGDLYIMDYIGMLGVSLVPDSKYPENSKVIFLPTQAASDKDILPKIMRSVAGGAKVIMTTGFIANAAEGEKLAQLAKIKWPLQAFPVSAETLNTENQTVKLNYPLTFDYCLAPDSADVLLKTNHPLNNVFLTMNNAGTVYVINSHTFSQKDFDSVGEVLLCPRPAGLTELPRPWTNTLRKAFQTADDPLLDAASRVTLQTLTNGNLVIQNYNQEESEIGLKLPAGKEYVNGFTGNKISAGTNETRIKMAPRSKLWIRN